MLINTIAKAAIDITKEISKEAVKDNFKIIVKLDKPLNSVEIKDEIILKKSYDNSSLKELDKPLNFEYNMYDIRSIVENEVDKIIEFDENGFRMLDESEKMELKENTKWSDEAIDGCKINENGVIKYPCRNENLAGETNELTGVNYEKRIVEAYGYKTEVVIPEFESSFEVKLPNELIEASDIKQFKECNKQLSAAIKENPDLAKNFTEEQLKEIEDGNRPFGYTWHHDAETGKMQLVNYDLHRNTRHTGGKAIWGGGKDYR